MRSVRKNVEEYVAGVIFAAEHLAWAVPRASPGAELFFGSFFLFKKKEQSNQDNRKKIRK